MTSITAKFAPFAAALALAASTAAIAQTTPPATPSTPSIPPSTTTKPMTPPAATAPSPSTGTQSSTTASAMTLTDEQAKAWVDKPVYSSDDKKIGEVAALQRDGSGKVTEMLADIGGFLGLGETRVRVTPEQFVMKGDRVSLNVNSEQAKTLPKVAK